MAIRMCLNELSFGQFEIAVLKFAEIKKGKLIIRSQGKDRQLYGFLENSCTIL